MSDDVECDPCGAVSVGTTFCDVCGIDYCEDCEEFHAAVHLEVARAQRCPLCGEPEQGHDEAACDEKMRNWRPMGILALFRDDQGSAPE